MPSPAGRALDRLLDRPAAGGCSPTTNGCIVARSAEPAPGHRMGTPILSEVRRELERSGGGGAQLQLRPLRRHEPKRSDGHPRTLVERAGGLKFDRRGPSAACTGAASSDLSWPGAWPSAPAGAAATWLPVAVGIAPLQGALAKLGQQAWPSRIPAMAACFDLRSVADPDPWAAAVANQDVWGIGPQAPRAGGRPAGAVAMPRCSCASWPAVSLRAKAGVVGLRLPVTELRAAASAACRWWRCRPPPSRKPASSRAFSGPKSASCPSLRAGDRHLTSAAPPKAAPPSTAQRTNRTSRCFRAQQGRSTAPVFTARPPVHLPLGQQTTTAVLLAAAPAPGPKRCCGPHKPLQEGGCACLQNPAARGAACKHQPVAPLPPDQQASPRGLEWPRSDGSNFRR